MKLYTELTTIQTERPTAIALGFFDGLHVGHRELIRETVAHAKANGLQSAVFTFSDSSKSGTAGTALMSWPERRKALEALGVDVLFAPAFDDALRSMEPECFAQEILCGRCAARYVACGFNYRFGHGAKGTPALLQEWGTRLGFRVYVQAPVCMDDAIVSSTRIRRALAEGDMEEAAACLGRLYSVSGETVPGKQIGRTLGFPTCNLKPDPAVLLPRDGVYATVCRMDGTRYASVTNVGSNPTVGGTERRVETHILGLEAQTLYGKEICVEFLQFLRPEIVFENRAALQEQIAQDKETVLQYFDRQQKVIQ